MVIAVIDGMGGGIGAQIVTQLRQELPLEVEIQALGANAIATQQMMEAFMTKTRSLGLLVFLILKYVPIIPPKSPKSPPTIPPISPGCIFVSPFS